MCYWKNKAFEMPLKATKDITVFKVVRNYTLTKKGFTSKYRRFEYKFGKTEKGVINTQSPNSIEIGYHSYGTVKYYKTLQYGRNIVGAKKYNGYRVYTPTYYDAIIIECIIPKGSQYYFNGTDYVSDSIKPICVILPEEKIFNALSTDFKNLIKSFKITTITTI